jgi:HPt (histidine-containing phosphotransfer) domain-containing protein
MVAAHSIKGQALNLRFRLLAGLAAGIETLCHDRNIPAARDQAPALRHEWNQLLPILDRV